MTQKWRPVVGFEGYYEVSESGVVRSVERVIEQANRGGTIQRRLYGARVLVGCIKKGYRYVNLTVANKSCHKSVHKLVAEAFLGKCPDGLEVCHGDGNKMNNHFENLRYGTPQDNSDDRVRHGRSNPGSRCHLSKLCESDVGTIRAEYLAVGAALLASRFGVTPNNIGAIVARRTWRHI